MLRSKLVLASAMSILFMAFLAGPVWAVESDEVVGIWLFDGGSEDVAVDSSENGYDGEIRPAVKRDDGKFGNALLFPGTVTANSYVTIPHQESLNLEEHSITAWINVEPTAGDWQIIMAKWNPHDVRNYSILTNQNTGTFFAQLTSGGAAQWKTADTNIDVTDEQWYHVACTYDGAILKAYINGEMKAQTGTGPGDVNDGELTIGARWAGTHPTTGIIDDVGLFNVALEEDDILDIMARGLKEFLSLAPVEPGGKLASTWGKIKAR